MHSLAQHLQSQGRGNDTVLVHMTPREVGGLQALAQSAGGTLTRNPTTGLPEAGFLDSILPMIAGVAGGALGINPYLVSAGVGAITGIATGNLEKGLMSGLGAYGGAALGRTINPEGTIGGFGFGTPAAPPTPSLTTINAAPASAAVTAPDPYYQMSNSPLGVVAPSVSPASQTISVEEPAGFFDRFSANAARGLEGTGLAGVAPYAAGLGLVTPFLGSSSSGLGALKPTEPRKLPPPRMFNRRPTYPVNRDPRDSSEFMYFDPSVPYFEPRPETVTSNQDYRSLARGLSSAFSPLMFADGGAVEARPRFAPDVAAPAGYAAQAPARSYVEQLYNFPRATNVPKLVKPTAETAALQAQYPTATKAQLSEYERAIAGGGDPKATLSLMKAYSPASNYTSLQPWSPDFKGFDYKRSRPTDEFGNPIGWTPTAEEQASADNAMGRARMSMEGITEPDSDFLAGFRGMVSPMFSDYGDPSWGMNVETFKDAPPMLKDSMFNRATGYTGSGSDGMNYANTYNTYKTNQTVEGQRQAAMAANAAAGTDPGEYVGNSPDGFVPMADTGRYFAPWANQPAAQPTAGTGSTFLNYLNQNMAAPRSTSTAAPSVGFFNNPVEYLGNKVSDVYNDLGNIGNWTTGEFVNAGLNFLPTGIPGVVGGMLAGGIGVPLPEGRSYVTSPPLSYQAGQEAREFIQNLFKPKGQAAGGVNLEDGSFVVDARTVAELGNGSSGAGQELLARMGGKPIKGPGDGVSDSIRANIGGKQEARVARDEVKFDPEAVKRVGGGNPKKGADRLYAMMRKAEKARKSASRGKDTGLRALVGEK